MLLLSNPFERNPMDGRCEGLNVTIIRDIAGDIGIERDYDFYNRLKIFDLEATMIKNRDAKKGETDEEREQSMKDLARKYDGN